MQCSRCGNNIREGADFCPRCGLTIRPVGGNGEFYNNYPKNNKNDNSKAIIAIVMVSVFVIVAAVIVCTLMLVSNSGGGKTEATSTPILTETPTPEPTATPAPEVTPEVIYAVEDRPAVNNVIPNPDYTRFSSSLYGYSINYPSHYIAYNDSSAGTLYAVQEPDGSAREIIAAMPIGNETVSSSMSSFISAHPGTITYQTSGNDYYAANIRNGDIEYYKYCKFRNGSMCWFEFIYPAALHSIYDGYINDIYKSIERY
ncbi:MAG: zinc ribbon domain-containing protein [Clostridia bacterium]|nr:zinc ribbon domain-containing protein [Clostridia bacterium]